MRAHPQQQKRLPVRYLLDVVLVAAVIYAIWLLWTGRLNMPLGATFTQQQKIVQLYNYRTEYNADVSALRGYRNELNYTAAGAKHDAITASMGETSTRCRQAVAGYDDLASGFSAEYLAQQNVPAQLDDSQCSSGL